MHVVIGYFVCLVIAVETIDIPVHHIIIVDNGCHNSIFRIIL